VPRKKSKRYLDGNPSTTTLSALLPGSQEHGNVDPCRTASFWSSVGCDPFVRIETVVALVGLSVPTVYRLMSRGDFPRPIKLTATARGWKLSEVAAWMRRREVETGKPCERAQS
jgi:prophage regulatory protein